MQGASRAWKRSNVALVVMIIGINLYIFSAPFVPLVQLWLRQRHARPVAGLPYKTRLETVAVSNVVRADIPKDNRLVIPKLALDQHIYEGDSPYLVNQGVWANPKTSTPPEGGNMVLIGHRFTYNGPATFYSLDKVAVGDNIVIYWQGKEYDYPVSSTRVVPSTDTSVEDFTSQAQLTIYTCTPLWSAKNRLVVIAKPINVVP